LTYKIYTDQIYAGDFASMISLNEKDGMWHEVTGVATNLFFGWLKDR